MSVDENGDSHDGAGRNIPRGLLERSRQTRSWIHLVDRMGGVAALLIAFLIFIVLKRTQARRAGDCSRIEQ